MDSFCSSLLADYRPFYFLKFYYAFLLILNLKVLCQWLMDQAPIGNKAPRPGFARQMWCPACRGLLEHPLPLTSGHVLLDCMVIEGIYIVNLKPIGSGCLQFTQVHESVKGSEGFLLIVPGLEGARSLLIIFTSMAWMRKARRYRIRLISKEELVCLNSLTCG